MNNIILKLGHTNVPQESSEGVLISKISSSLTPLSLLYLVKTAQNKINPRTATVNQITRSIQSTLSDCPELFWYKTKGILTYFYYPVYWLEGFKRHKLKQPQKPKNYSVDKLLSDLGII